MSSQRYTDEFKTEAVKQITEGSTLLITRRQI
jgi:transposase-like protein